MRELHIITSRLVTASIEKFNVNWELPAWVCVRAHAVVGIRTRFCAENKYASVDSESLRKIVMSQNSWFWGPTTITTDNPG